MHVRLATCVAAAILAHSASAGLIVTQAHRQVSVATEVSVNGETASDGPLMMESHDVWGAFNPSVQSVSTIYSPSNAQHYVTGSKFCWLETRINDSEIALSRTTVGGGFGHTYPPGTPGISGGKAYSYLFDTTFIVTANSDLHLKGSQQGDGTLRLFDQAGSLLFNTVGINHYFDLHVEQDTVFHLTGRAAHSSIAGSQGGTSDSLFGFIMTVTPAPGTAVIPALLCAWSGGRRRR